MFLLVSNFKMIGMLLNVVHGQVQKSQQKSITKETNGFHNQFTLITLVQACRKTPVCRIKAKLDQQTLM